MRCRDVMRTDVVTIRAEESVLEAALRMKASGVRSLPVCTFAGRPLGVVTDHAIATLVVAHAKPYSTLIKHVMSTDVPRIDARADVDEARALFATVHVSQAFVVDETGAFLGTLDADVVRKLPRVTSSWARLLRALPRALFSRAG